MHLLTGYATRSPKANVKTRHKEARWLIAMCKFNDPKPSSPNKRLRHQKWTSKRRFALFYTCFFSFIACRSSSSTARTPISSASWSPRCRLGETSTRRSNSSTVKKFGRKSWSLGFAIIILRKHSMLVLKCICFCRRPPKAPNSRRRSSRYTRPADESSTPSARALLVGAAERQRPRCTS